jgi:hypothetical protein
MREHEPYAIESGIRVRKISLFGTRHRGKVYENAIAHREQIVFVSFAFFTVNRFLPSLVFLRALDDFVHFENIGA